ncbi:general transcription factor 3C polypeptide 3-like [Octopus bimaculoides]|nr:general transcription factor 3C polypeptide 3-like [Octopus bimaculoides]
MLILFHLLGEYVNVYRQQPSDPLVNLCIGLAFIHMACQKFSSKKHALLIQGLSFVNAYTELRGECQETLYNVGRAMHQLGLTYAAVFYYKKAIHCSPPVGNKGVSNSFVLIETDFLLDISLKLYTKNLVLQILKSFT